MNTFSVIFQGGGGQLRAAYMQSKTLRALRFKEIIVKTWNHCSENPNINIKSCKFRTRDGWMKK